MRELVVPNHGILDDWLPWDLETSERLLESKEFVRSGSTAWSPTVGTMLGMDRFSDVNRNDGDSDLARSTYI